MKKNHLILFVLILLCTVQVYSQSDNLKTIKRKVLMLPFVNKNKVVVYDYLSTIIMETLRSELMETHIYEFTNFSLSNDKLKEHKTKDFNDLIQVKKIAKELSADLVITGQYLIYDNRILILIHAIDIFSGELLVMSKEEGSTGVDLFNVINRVSMDLREKMINKFPMMNGAEYEDKLKESKKYILTPLRKSGIGLVSSGSSLLMIGLPLLIYDLAGYSQVLSANKDRYLNTNEYYKEYDESYNIFVGLLVSSICISGTGFILAAIGVPLMVIKIKETKKQNISFIIGFDKKLAFNSNDLFFAIHIRLN